MSNIRPSKEKLNLVTNAGVLEVRQQADVENYGTVWFNEQAMTNVFSLASMERKYPVAYTSKDSAFIVHRGDNPVRFELAEDNLYSIDTAVQLVQTVKDQAQNYTPRQIKSAKAARTLMQTLGYPTVRDMQNILKSNAIANCPVTSDDVNLAVQIYGPEISPIKGKTTRKKPTPVKGNTVQIPKELREAQRDVDLCFDTMFVNGLPFFTTISKRLMYRTAEAVTSTSMNEYKAKLTNVLRIYQNAGFRVSCVYCDGEFKPLKNWLLDDYDIKMNATSAREHVPEAERNIRVIKERVRAIYHGLPFQAMPKLLLQYLVSDVARKLNYFPNPGSVSPYYSPRELLHQRKLEFDKHCAIPQFAYVQAHEEPTHTNGMAARSLDCLYLRPTTNIQGGHELFNLQTHRVITRRSVTVIPMPQRVIDAINDLAKSDGAKSLKIGTRAGILYDSTEPAGVDTDLDIADEIEIEIHDGIDIADETEADSEQEGDNESEQEDDNPEEEPNESEMAANQEVTKIEEEDPVYADVDGPRRSSRMRNPPDRLNLVQYQDDEAKILAHIMVQFNERMEIQPKQVGHQFVTTYSLRQGIKQFKDKGTQAATAEMQQMLDRKCFQPINKEELSSEESKRALESLIFLTEKRDGRIKARHCANGSTQRAYMDKDQVSSPTVSLEALLLTAVIDAEENRDVATCDIPNAFIQTDLEDHTDGTRTIMKIRGELVDILCDMDPEYERFVVIEGRNRHRVLYVQVIKAIYGLLISSMLFYKKLRTDLQTIGFKLNPYDICVANRDVEGKQQTVTWHVDDLKSSHKNPKVNDEFIKWLNETYGEHGKVKEQRGKHHEYIGMTLDYTVEGEVTIDMVDYVKAMVDNFPNDLTKIAKVASPWTEKLFKVEKESPKLSSDKASEFHTITAQGLFLCKRARPDIAPVIAYLTTRVREPSESDWKKLERMMKFLQQTMTDRLTLRSDGTRVLKWGADATFAVHEDMRSHTGGMVTMGKGAIMSYSRKQSLNTRSLTEAEIVAADDMVGPMLWAQRFLEAQGYKLRANVLLQDNQSAIKMETNGRSSAGKRSRHLDIRLFYVTDQIEKGLIEVEFCPTNEMTADYFTKPVHGKKFQDFRNTIMNLNSSFNALSRQECVGGSARQAD